VQRINALITLVLAAAAAGIWTFCVVQARQTFSVPPVLLTLAITLTITACFGWILVFLGHRRGDNETRCRKCGYILRGISAPRCPECGEQI
jgi:hypothetical protein